MSDYTTLPQGLIAAVTRIVNRYTSAEPIGRGELVNLVRRAGYDVTERTVREAIKQAVGWGHCFYRHLAQMGAISRPGTWVNLKRLTGRNTAQRSLTWLRRARPCGGRLNVSLARLNR